MSFSSFVKFSVFCGLIFVLCPFNILFAQTTKHSYEALGVAAMSCQKFIVDDSNTYMSDVYEEAANGMITGMNLTLFVAAKGSKDITVGSKSDEEFRHQWLKKYCLENPNANYLDAVKALYFFMFSKNM